MHDTRNQNRSTPSRAHPQVEAAEIKIDGSNVESFLKSLRMAGYQRVEGNDPHSDKIDFGALRSILEEARPHFSKLLESHQSPSQIVGLAMRIWNWASPKVTGRVLDGFVAAQLMEETLKHAISINFRMDPVDRMAAWNGLKPIRDGFLSIREIRLAQRAAERDCTSFEAKIWKQGHSYYPLPAHHHRYSGSETGAIGLVERHLSRSEEIWNSLKTLMTVDASHFRPRR